ncbi:MAG TPA: glycosyltransferase family 39 protein [Gemmatimonadales bacterium]|nr:glycosyltransferase family 39 protein [Gemmatimonadales bacterium]
MPADAPRVRGTTWALAGLLVLGLGLRLYHLGTGLWFDEIETLVEYVRSPLGQILRDYHSNNQHPLYSVLAHLSIGALGESGAALRLPAALLGTASLAAYYRLALRIVDRREALLGMALLTFSYHHLWFSQNARGYSGLLLLSLLATLALLRLLDEKTGWGAVAGYGLCAGLAVYIHPTAVLLAVAHAILLAWTWWRVRTTNRWLGRRAVAALGCAAGVSLLLYAPMLGQVVTTLTGRNPHGAATAWQSPLWFVVESLRGLAGGLPGGWAGVAAAALVLLAGLLALWRQRPLLVALFLLPGLLTAVVLVLVHQNFWPRFFFFSAGFAVLVALRGGFVLAQLLFGGRGRALATGGAILAIAGSAATLPRAWRPKQDFLGAERQVERVRAPEDAVVTVDLTEYPYLRWRGDAWEAARSLPALEAIEAQHRRTWLLYTFPVRLAVVQPGIWQRLAARYDTAAVFPGTVGGGDIVVMVSKASPPAP